MGLEIENLGCVRGGRRVLEGVSFALEPGRALMLRGPNGAGKSTLLRALAGLVPCDGLVRLNGIDLADRDAWEDRVAYTGHLDAIKPQLSVEENLRFWATLFGGDADAAMGRMALTEIAERPAGLCSAGQKRRLGLARLLLAQRDLWLMDEPTVSLDAASTEILAAAIGEHCARGGLAIVATHIDLGLRAEEFRIDPIRVSATTDPFAEGPFA